jgi:hypothetical protein
MNRSDLIQRIFEKNPDLLLSMVDEVLKTLLEQMTETLISAVASRSVGSAVSVPVPTRHGRSVTLKRVRRCLCPPVASHTSNRGNRCATTSTAAEVRQPIHPATLSILASSLFLTGSLDVYAEWQPYASAAVNGERHFLDPARIKPTPVGFVLSNYPVPIKNSFGTFQSVGLDIEMDCENHQLRDISMKFLRTPMGKGKGSFKKWAPAIFNPGRTGV